MENKKITDLLDVTVVSEDSYTVVEDGLSTKKMSIGKFLKTFFQGIVVMWSGSLNTLPKGWVLCNGLNGTPDLRDKFVLGAGNKYAVRAAGGTETHSLTIDEMPRHGHGQIALHSRYSNSGSHNDTGGITLKDGVFPSGSNNQYKTIEQTGKSLAHNNMPPYYALAFIMYKGS